jgi:hypothetical protein
MADDLSIGYSAKVAGGIFAGALVLGVLFTFRGVQDLDVLDGAIVAVLASIAVRSAMVLVDRRAPLLVADERGVRIRIAGEWCGFPWISIAEYSVRHRRFPWADGRLLFELHHPSHVTEGLSPLSRREVTHTQKRYGVPLSVPLGLMTGVSRREERSLCARLGALASDTREGNPADRISSEQLG